MVPPVIFHSRLECIDPVLLLATLKRIEKKHPSVLGLLEVRVCLMAFFFLLGDDTFCGYKGNVICLFEFH